MQTFCNVRDNQDNLEYCLTKLHIFPTYKCSAACKHCWQTSYRDTVRATLDLLTLSKFLQTLDQIPFYATVLGGSLLTLDSGYLKELFALLEDSQITTSVVLEPAELATNFLDIFSRVQAVNISYEPGRRSSNTNLSSLEAVKSAIDFFTLNQIPTNLLVALTSETLDTPTSELITLLYKTLEPSTITFLPISPSAADAPSYLKTSRKLIELFSLLPHLDIKRTTPLNHAFPTSQNILGGSISCSKRLSLSIHPDDKVFVGSMRVGHGYDLETEVFNNPTFLSTAFLDFQRRIPDLCKECFRFKQCLAYFEGRPNKLYDQQQDCLGLKHFYSYISNLTNVFRVYQPTNFHN